jgi:hypothetical protein
MLASGLGRAAASALAVAGLTYTSMWQVAIVLGVIVAGGLALRLFGRMRGARKDRRHAP